MNLLKKTALALSLTGLAAAPIAAQAVDRAAAPVTGESESNIGGGGDLTKGLIIVAIAGIGMAILLATDDDDDDIDAPVSA